MHTSHVHRALDDNTKASVRSPNKAMKEPATVNTHAPAATSIWATSESVTFRLVACSLFSTEFHHELLASRTIKLLREPSISDIRRGACWAASRRVRADDILLV